MKRILLILPIVLLAAGCNHNALSPSGHRPKTYYIDGASPNASDAHDGLSAAWDGATQSGPFATIAHALGRLEPGDTA